MRDPDQLTITVPEGTFGPASPDLALIDGAIPVLCQHKDFSISFEMAPDKAATGFVARVRIWCAACGQPFFFSGLGCDDDGIKPHVELDGTQVHLPLGAYYGPSVSTPI